MSKKPADFSAKAHEDRINFRKNVVSNFARTFSLNMQKIRQKKREYQVLFSKISSQSRGINK